MTATVFLWTRSDSNYFLAIARINGRSSDQAPSNLNISGWNRQKNLYLAQMQYISESHSQFKINDL